MRWGRVGYLRLGTTLSPHLLVGLQGILFDAAVGGDGWKTRSNLTASLLAYPSATSGFFFKAGVGYASDEYRRSSDPDPFQPASRSRAACAYLRTTSPAGRISSMPATLFPACQ